MKKIWLLTLLPFIVGCDKFAPEYEPFTGYKTEIPKVETVSVSGIWKLESGYRIEKYHNTRDSIKIVYANGVPNKIYSGTTNEKIDNITVGSTSWMFKDNFFFYNSLDRYDYSLQLNKTIDILLFNTKRLFFIQSLTSTTMIVKSGTQYVGSAGENSNYSILQFRKTN